MFVFFSFKHVPSPKKPLVAQIKGVKWDICNEIASLSVTFLSRSNIQLGLGKSYT